MIPSDSSHHYSPGCSAPKRPITFYHLSSYPVWPDRLSINNGSSANIFGINTGQGVAYGIYNEESTIGTLNNYGTISATANGGGAAYGVVNINGAI